VTTDADLPPLRGRLARALLRLRKASGQSQEQLGAAIGISQGQVSKIESGTRVPSVDDVRAWARATGASVADREDVVDLAVDAQIENVRWRDALRDGLPAKQREIARNEAAATVVRNYQCIIVPGLLQVRAYARAIAELADPFPEEREDPAGYYERTTDERMARQQALYNSPPGKFEFVMAEAALWWRAFPVEVALTQVDRVRAALSLPAVSIGIIPRTAELPALVMNPFVVFEGPADEGLPFVRAESVHGEGPITDLDVVARYQAKLKQLRSAALFGDDARALLDRVAGELRQINK
jgi:transcriptional regulator with XRE-family HTH domain